LIGWSVDFNLKDLIYTQDIEVKLVSA